jgi:cobalamin-dependent methionine synthase I
MIFLLIVGEKINSSLKGVAPAVKARDVEFISKLAQDQTAGGANYIDVNCGTLLNEEVDALPWLVETVQQHVDLPCCIDSPNPLALEKALRVHSGKAMVNSITAEKLRYAAIMPLVRQYGAGIIALVMDDEHGMPSEAPVRIEIGVELINKLVSDGILISDIYIDPLIQPISTNGDMGVVALETIMGVKRVFPEAHFMCGLSNISYGLPKRGLLNRTFMSLCMMVGLDGAILDPENKPMMAVIRATEALLDKDSYTANYLKAFRAGILDC